LSKITIVIFGRFRCPQCGTSLPDEASYCSGCGAAIQKAGPPPRVNAATYPSATEPRPLESSPIVASGGGGAGEELPIPENIAGVVTYVTIVPAILFLFVDPFKRNYFVRFHAFQHLFLWVAGFVFGIAAAILGAILQLIPFMRVLVFPLVGLIALAWFFLWVLLVVKAYQHELFKLPIIGDLAEQQASA
jgi:uncharacterized membrane protein